MALTFLNTWEFQSFKIFEKIVAGKPMRAKQRLSQVVGRVTYSRRAGGTCKIFFLTQWQEVYLSIKIEKESLCTRRKTLRKGY